MVLVVLLVLLISVCSLCNCGCALLGVALPCTCGRAQKAVNSLSIFRFVDAMGGVLSFVMCKCFAPKLWNRNKGKDTANTYLSCDVSSPVRWQFVCSAAVIFVEKQKMVVYLSPSCLVDYKDRSVEHSVRERVTYSAARHRAGIQPYDIKNIFN